MSKLIKNDRLIGIIGTGNYGTALGKRFINFGFNVLYGSREPNEKYIKENFQNNQDYVSITSINEVWLSDVNIIFFAIDASVYETLVKNLMNINVCLKSNKIVVDISNKSLICINNNNNFIKENSNAEYLQKCFNKYTNKVTIIKAFNNISAYSMNLDCSCESNINFGNGEAVAIAGDDIYKCEKIRDLANNIGFRSFYVGNLKKSRKLERINENLFIEWKYPTFFSLSFLLFNMIWYFFYSFIFNSKYKNFNEYLKLFSLIPYLNRVFAFSSINLLSFVYLAGIFATLYQLYYGTKHKKFPVYLDLWLKSRKYLGLWSFIYATLHLILSLCILTPAYFSPWFKKISPQKIFNETIVNYKYPNYTLYGEINILTGIIAYSIMCILAISSINSISLSLNWSEWRFIQSKCGILCLTISLIHVIIMFIRFIIERETYKYTKKHILTRVKFLTIWLPLIVLILRFIFANFKPINQRIKKIRNSNYIINHYKKKDNQIASEERILNI